MAGQTWFVDGHVDCGHCVCGSGPTRTPGEPSSPFPSGAAQPLPPPPPQAYGTGRQQELENEVEKLVGIVQQQRRAMAKMDRYVQRERKEQERQVRGAQWHAPSVSPRGMLRSSTSNGCGPPHDPRIQANALT